jgi:rhamnosyltransferase
MIENIFKPENVCAILVTYNPNISELKDNIKSVINYVDRICLIDNSTDEFLQTDIMNFHSDFNIHVISNKNNLGIAYAQNQGFDWAIKQGYDFFLLLDQDSKIEEDTVEKLLSTHKLLSVQNKKVACVGPLAFDRDKTENSLYNNYGLEDDKVLEVSETLSSGSLISKKAIKEIGNMEEDLFIDLVDYEWCWRAKNKGYSTFIARDVKLAHRLGEGRVGVSRFSIGIPSPIRHYYQFRNTLIMLRRPYVPKDFKVKYAGILPIKFLFFLLFSKPRLLRIKFMIKGVVDGFIGKKGKYS